ncbi:hypothetical protein BJ742DRAFT_774630 [Cladochytrium replicatum]|nr:hypothetical protein BJ742DRAFT_774630 [Cladochytrium replicatum]
MAFRFDTLTNSIRDRSGSGQQSVTGFAKGDDPNSYFVVFGTTASPCIRGEAMECNRQIRLQHVSTKKFTVATQALYQTTRKPLRTTATIPGMEGGVHKLGTQYHNPIPGQLEVSWVTASGPSEQWVAVEGIYYSDRKYD